MPGQHYKFKILLKNESGNTYYYKDNSFMLAPEDTSEFGNTADGSCFLFLPTMDNFYLLSLQGL